MPYVLLDSNIGAGNSGTVNAVGAATGGMLISGSGASGIGNATNTDSDGNVHNLRVQRSGNAANAMYDKFSPAVASSSLSIGHPGLGSSTGVALLAFAGGNGPNVDGDSGTSLTSLVTQIRVDVGVTPTVADQLIVAMLSSTSPPTGGNANVVIDQGFTIVEALYPVPFVNFGLWVAIKIGPPLTLHRPMWSWAGALEAATTIVLYGPADEVEVGELKTWHRLGIRSTTHLKSWHGLEPEEDLKTWHNLRPIK